jgi:hypothetical protein
VDIERAHDLVLAEIDRSVTACTLTTPRIAVTIHPTARGWTISVPVQGKVSGLSTWMVADGKVNARNAIARTISAGC